jgi:hypothetical protein
VSLVADDHTKNPAAAPEQRSLEWHTATLNGELDSALMPSEKKATILACPNHERFHGLHMANARVFVSEESILM